MSSRQGWGFHCSSFWDTKIISCQLGKGIFANTNRVKLYGKVLLLSTKKNDIDTLALGLPFPQQSHEYLQNNVFAHGTVTN